VPELDRLVSWGLSGGGPHVPACAALLPGVEARFYDNEGHGLRDDHIGEVRAWLAERL
jgi:hypothetical protein